MEPSRGEGANEVSKSSPLFLKVNYLMKIIHLYYLLVTA
jgi:hypothetical protein